MKILVFSDIHLNARTCGVPRFDELATTLDRIGSFAIVAKYDAVIFVGDAVDPDAPDLVRCLALLASEASRIGRSGIDSYWLAGNHDVTEDGYGTSVLQVIEQACPRAYCIEVPDKLPVNGEIVFLPYPSKCNTYDASKFIADHCDSKTQIIFGHLNLPGEGGASETFEMSRGKEHYWPLEAIARVCPQAVLIGGHYHVGGLRAFTMPSGHAVYVDVVGSPAPFAFGAEEKCVPSVLSIELTGGRVETRRLSLRDDLSAKPSRMVTVPLNAPKESWSDAGFVRILVPAGTEPSGTMAFVQAVGSVAQGVKVEVGTNEAQVGAVPEDAPAFTAEDGIQIAKELAERFASADAQLNREIVALTALLAERT